MAASSKGISKDTLRQLLSVISIWYDDRGCISMLKVLYTDHIEIVFDLDEASKTIDLLQPLITHGHLSEIDLAILYDTIKATKHFGLEKEIKEKIPSCANLEESHMPISKFTSHRQKLMKLGMVLKKDDIARVNGRYNTPVKKYTDSWSLIMDLEHRTIICEKNINIFVGELKRLELPRAVSALTEDPCVDLKVELGQKRKRENECEDLEEHKGKQRKLSNYYNYIWAKVEEFVYGSILFHLSLSNHHALMNLWEIHLSGELITDIAEILVPKDLQQQFLNEWKTGINEVEYKAALSKLKEYVKSDSYDVCIISDDREWEDQLMQDLKQRRPDINCTIMKKWRLSYPETVNHLIGQSRNVLIAFSSKPLLTDYSKYAAHSVVFEMLEAKTLDDAKVIRIKISEHAVVPPEFVSSTAVSAWEEHFVDNLLQNLVECAGVAGIYEEAMAKHVLEKEREIVDTATASRGAQDVEVDRML